MRTPPARLLNGRIACIGARRFTARALAGVLLTIACQGVLAKTQTVPNAVPLSEIRAGSSDAHWLEFPTNPFLEAGRTNDGELDPDRMISRWRQAGLQTQDTEHVQAMLAPLVPVLMGVRDAELERVLLNEARAADQRLRQQFPEVVKQLQVMHTAKPTMDGDMQDAKHALARAVTESGLRLLRLPIEQWSSSETMRAVAGTMKAANEDLQRATGWQGQVLGLGGRVELTIGEPTSARAGGGEGLAFVGRDGRVQVISQWNTLAHEWFHALDYTVGRMSLGARGTMSDATKQHQQEVLGWGQTMERIQAASPQWQQYRHEAGTGTDGKAYWLDASEGMAYAFSAYLTRTTSPRALTETTLDKGNMEEPQRSPSAEETERHTALFRNLFNGLGRLGLNGRTPLGLDQLMQQRRERGFEPVRVPVGRTLR